jgi:hypothetical protein
LITPFINRLHCDLDNPIHAPMATAIFLMLLTSFAAWPFGTSFLPRSTPVTRVDWRMIKNVLVAADL